LRDAFYLPAAQDAAVGDDHAARESTLCLYLDVEGGGLGDERRVERDA